MENVIIPLTIKIQGLMDLNVFSLKSKDLIELKLLKLNAYILSHIN